MRKNQETYLSMVSVCTAAGCVTAKKGSINPNTKSGGRTDWSSVVFTTRLYQISVVEIEI